MKLHQLTIFRAVMRFGSVTRAAEMLNMTQPNVSKTIRNVEDEIGIKLFRRIGGRLTPTPEAEALSIEAEKLHSEVEIFDKFASQLRTRSIGSLKIAALPAFSTNLIPESIARFRASYPDIRVELFISHIHLIHDAVSRRHADLGLIHYPEFAAVETIALEKLTTRPIVCIAPHGHRFKDFEVVSGPDLRNELFISYPDYLPFRQVIQKALTESGAEIEPMIIANHTSLILQLVKQGVGVALVDSFAIKSDDPDIVTIPFDRAPSISIGILSPRGRPKSALATAYLEIIYEMLR
jgi:DNA-binding transcriptional LysR family regulator